MDDRTLVIANGRVCTPFETLDKGMVVVREGRIAFVAPFNRRRLPEGAKVIDASGKIVLPGFVDVHVHGARGYDVMDGTYDAIDRISRFLARTGVTAFLPTTVSAPQERMLASARAVRESTERGVGGARPLGLHMEGPYINPERRGAQNVEHIRPPSIEEVQEVLRACGDRLRMVTLAPEMSGAMALISFLKERGIIPSMGHTNATFREAMAGFQKGVRHAAHVFNAMRGFHHREPGALGAILIRDDVTVELIADWVHVHPVSIRLLLRLKGSDRVVLITDSIRAAGMPDGTYELGGLEVIVRDGICRLKTGSLAGSTLTLNKAVGNVTKRLGLPLSESVKMATVNPARLLEIDDRKGSLEPGKDADIVVADRDMNISMTIVQGRIAFSS